MNVKRFLRHARLFPLLFVLVCLEGAAPERASEAGEFKRHLWFLASDELKGRGNDQPEIDQSADYIADWFRRYSLVPGGDNSTYFHEFEARTEVELGPGTNLRVDLPEEKAQLNLGSDYIPLFSGPSPVSAPLAFAGFGISAPDLGYDDYAGFDARGKIVAVFQHEPEEEIEGSRFAGSAYSPWATLTYKAMNARIHGAVGLLVLPDPHCDRERTWKQDVQVEALGIPVVKLREEWGRRLFRAGPVRSTDLSRAAKNLLLQPFDIPDVKVSLCVEAIERYRILRNVVGILPGTRDDYVVIGAHYDHLGLGRRKALAPENVGQIHNGADDNASGTAGMLSLAWQLSGSSDVVEPAAVDSVRRPASVARRLTPVNQGLGIAFIAFAGEELGLLGSSAFVSRPSIPLTKIRAMVNLDMIGRSDGTLYIGGVGTATEFREWLDGLKARTPLNLNYADTPQAPSDHLAFAGEKIPVLFFFSGLHPDYHQPSDDREKIDQFRALDILQLVEAVTRKLTQPDQPVHFVETDSSSALLGASFGSPVFGIVTEPSWEADSVLVTGVKPSSPAFAAGLRRGDIIIACDGEAVMNRLDLVEQLKQSQRGAATSHPLLIVRGEEISTLMLSAN